MFEALNNFLSNPGVGIAYRKNNSLLVRFYEAIYFDFGLPPSRHLNDGAKVPLRITTSGFNDDKLRAFEVHGTKLHLDSFLTDNWGNVFNTISRSIPVKRDEVWAFDISRLHEGILKGETTYANTEAYARSSTNLFFLTLINAAATKPLANVPAIRAEFGDIWNRFGIPDRLNITLTSIYPLNDSDYQRVIDFILHHYKNKQQPVTASYSWNPMSGMIELMVRENVLEPTPEQQQQGDGFPYDFYRGLGLIDDEDMVTIDTFLGPMRVHMTTNGAKEHLLNYKP